MKIHQVQQRTPEWFQLRVDHPLTASNAQAIASQGKGLETLCWEKVAEKYSSAEKETYSNPDIERGVELESQAKSIYEMESSNVVEEVGFITNENINNLAGASPDGLMSDLKAGVEIKCPNDVRFLKLLAGEDIDNAYQWQMQMQMLIGELESVYFIAYNPNFEKSLVVEIVEPDPLMQEKLQGGLAMGEKIISDIESKIK